MDVACLQAHPDTMLGRMFHSSFLEITRTISPPVYNTAATNTSTTTTTTDDNQNEQDDRDGEDEEEVGDDEGTEVSPSSSMCSSSTHVVDVEHWMAAAAVSPPSSSSAAARIPMATMTRSAPASYRSRWGSICAPNRNRTRLNHQQQHRAQRQHQMDIPVASGCGISANVFRVILDFYLVGRMSCPPGISVRQLKKACEYFLVPFNHETVSCNNLREFLL